MKRIVILALAGTLLASVTGCGSNAKAEDAEYIYGQIDSVSGNDIVLLLADYHEDADSSDTADKGKEQPSENDTKEKSSEDSGSGRKRQRPDKGEMPEGFDPSQFKRDKNSGEQSEASGSERKRPDKGEMPEGFDPETFDPSQFSGKMPEGFDSSKFSGEKPSRSSDAEGDAAKKDSDASKFSRRSSGSSKYTLTGAQEELRIPVGTTVTTAAGVETNFDVLKSGDYIRCSIETDSDGKTVITAVQIMEA